MNDFMEKKHRNNHSLCECGIDGAGWKLTKDVFMFLYSGTLREVWSSRSPVEDVGGA